MERNGKGLGKEGKLEEPKDKQRLMRFVAAERKRNLKNSVLFNGTQLCVFNQQAGYYSVPSSFTTSQILCKDFS